MRCPFCKGETRKQLNATYPDYSGIGCVNSSCLYFKHIPNEAIKMDNQHKKIKGYRDLSQEEINLMNKAKELADHVGELVAELRATDGLDQRWVATGATDLQKGFMSIIRGVAQPTTF